MKGDAKAQNGAEWESGSGGAWALTLALSRGGMGLGKGGSAKRRELGKRPRGMDPHLNPLPEG